MKELEKLISELKDRFDRWEHLKTYGGQDPSWADGCNMNLVRNHMYYYKTQIKELCEEKGVELPEIYYKKTPQEVNKDYMARADEIRKNARIALEKYKADKNYQYLAKTIHLLNQKQIRQTSIDNVIGYCTGLENFIRNDDLVSMRRHERHEGYLQSFADCRKEVEEALGKKPKERQVSLFEMQILQHN